MWVLLRGFMTQGTHEAQASDSLDEWHEIAEAYPDSSIAGDAWEEIIEFYICAGEIEEAENAVEEVKKMMMVNLQVNKNPYGYGLASLFEYYMVVGDTTGAEEYAKRLREELIDDCRTRLQSGN